VGRICKVFGSGTTIYVGIYPARSRRDGDNVAEELGGGGNLLARYTQGVGIDEPLAMYRGLTTSYFHADGLGSITSLTDGVGQLAASYVYDSFGNLTASTGTVTNPFQYTGRESDSETGLYYYRARYYNSIAGRFLSEDPLKSAGNGMTLYSYVGNSPASYIDPWGHCRILFNGSLIRIETNNGSQRLGPFPASNKTVCECGLKEGVYMVDKPQWLVGDGHETQLGSSPFTATLNRHQAFGTARIPLEVPGRSGIMIHARFPDTKELRPTEGCVRVHDPVASSMSQFFDAVCANDSPNSFHYYQRPWWGALR
jgi:RHS repeat-associated protein